MYNHQPKFRDKPLVLIVEDDKTNVQVLGSILSKENYDIAVAFDGSSAIKMMEQHIPDLILLDVLMPDMDGYAVCRKIRNSDRYRNVPVIFLTAKAEEADIVNGFENGGVDYLTKPFHAGELLARVKTHLELKRAREELYELTIIDELTGLYNRRHITNQLDHEVHRAGRYNLNFCLSLLDLDDFKKVNDTLGHPVGDLALKRFAVLAQKCIRKTDILGRVGGEEFCLILPETTLAEGSIVMERIRKTVEDQSSDSRIGVPYFTVSIGMTSKKGEIKDMMQPEEYLKRADQAMYKAKKAGKNRVIVVELQG
jgi:diguanylate cyclase (GGDEF)-like protein